MVDGSAKGIDGDAVVEGASGENGRERRCAFGANGAAVADSGVGGEGAVDGMEMTVEGVDGASLGSGAAGGIGTVAGEEAVLQGEGCVARRDGTPITFALKDNVG